MHLMTIGHFLGGIAAIIYNPADHKYLLLRRASTKDYAAGDWECVTGRVDQGEGFAEALYREVREEIGVEARIEGILGTAHFYRGAPTPENELLGVKFLCTVDYPERVAHGAEHSEQCWLSAKEIYVLLPADHWLYAAIQRAEILRNLAAPDFRAINWAE